MADCAETIRELEAFLDTALAPEIHTAIAAHLGGCTDCHQAFDFHAELRMVIRDKCHNDEMPPGLLARIELCFNDDLDGDGDIG